MYVVICKIDHCIHIHWCIVRGLGHNDPWVESHMWPQQTWGQRSSRGQWPLVQVFGKKGQCIHILWCIFKSIKYYNDCKSMWSRKQARLVVREPPCLCYRMINSMFKLMIATHHVPQIFGWPFDLCLETYQLRIGIIDLSDMWLILVVTQRHLIDSG